MICVALAFASCGYVRIPTRPTVINDTGEVPAELSRFLPYGNPSGATFDIENRDNYLLVRETHISSYNNSRGTINWTAWFTTAKDLGDDRDRPRFEADRTLPNGFRRVQYYDYSGSGFDRGHIVPSADRLADERLNEQTFLMTNIVPQTKSLNQFPWQKLESYARSLARRGDTTYQIAGVYGDRGNLRGKVTIPTNCWKVIVVLTRGQTQITSSTRVIAVDMPNVDGIEDVEWQRYQTTVRDIEGRTGLNLFSQLPPEIQETIETRKMIENR
ncbi:MAG TPA: DNA/RNA non-specific endonuclease [Pyrinomonadaceae bacterium]|nr:DNA/RNA non-specific endonuclease [Pyrinomonadaceae bacterium]